MGQAIYSAGGTYTWTCPTGVTSITVECWGSGGSGGTQGGDGTYIETGGGSGAYAKKNTVAVTPGNNYAVFVAYINTGGSTPTSFASTVCVATSGYMGCGVEGQYLAGAGGPVGTCVGDTVTGGNLATTLDGANCPNGGAGGTGTSVATASGTAGSSPGGGGGGGGNPMYNGFAGNGAPGQVKITWTDPVDQGSGSGSTKVASSGSAGVMIAGSGGSTVANGNLLTRANGDFGPPGWNTPDSHYTMTPATGPSGQGAMTFTYTGVMNVNQAIPNPRGTYVGQVWAKSTDFFSWGIYTLVGGSVDQVNEPYQSCVGWTQLTAQLTMKGTEGSLAFIFYPSVAVESITMASPVLAKVGTGGVSISGSGTSAVLPASTGVAACISNFSTILTASSGTAWTPLVVTGASTTGPCSGTGAAAELIPSVGGSHTVAMSWGGGAVAVLCSGASAVKPRSSGIAVFIPPLALWPRAKW